MNKTLTLLYMSHSSLLLSIFNYSTLNLKPIRSLLLLLPFVCVCVCASLSLSPEATFHCARFHQTNRLRQRAAAPFEERLLNNAGG